MGSDEISASKSNDAPASALTSYKMKPSLTETFKAVSVKEIIHEILTEKLQGKNYNVDDVRHWTRDIADAVNRSIKNRLVMPRYKYVVQVMLGQQLGAGCHYFAKCCWDVDADSLASDVFTNTSLFCVCTVFGIYLY